MKKYITLFRALLISVTINAQDYISQRRVFNDILKTAKDVSAFEIFIDTTKAYYYDFSVKLDALNRKSEYKNKKFCIDYWEKCRERINVDTALLFKITDMDFRDQSVREDDVDDREMWFVDSINRIELKKIILERGKLPGIREVDSFGLMCMNILTRHLIWNTDFFYFLHQYMLDATKEGNFVPEDIASNIDYYWFANQFIPQDSTKWMSYQLYGTMEFRLDKTTKIKVPVKDWEETERLRYELGMQSLKEELEETPNVIYDLDLFRHKFPKFQY
jgi:hypothetical protein